MRDRFSSLHRREDVFFVLKTLNWDEFLSRAAWKNIARHPDRFSENLRKLALAKLLQFWAFPHLPKS